jgi:hypothetical protein
MAKLKVEKRGSFHCVTDETGREISKHADEEGAKRAAREHNQTAPMHDDRSALARETSGQGPPPTKNTRGGVVEGGKRRKLDDDED